MDIGRIVEVDTTFKDRIFGDSEVATKRRHDVGEHFLIWIVGGIKSRSSGRLLKYPR